MKKKIASGSIILMILVSVVMGCNKEQPVNNSASTPIKVAVYDRGGFASSEGTIDNNRYTKWIKENCGVNVTFMPIPRNEDVQKYNLLFASNTAPDIVMTYSAVMRQQLINQERALPLDDIIEKYSVEYKQAMNDYPILRKGTTSQDGKIYEVGTLGHGGLLHGLFIRQDWLDNLGLKQPETVEELLNVLKAFTENDPDKNGKNDTYGISLAYINGIIIDDMFQNADYYVDGNGDMIKDWERLQAATEFKKTLYTKGWTDKDYITDTTGQKAKQDFINGRSGIMGDPNLKHRNALMFCESVSKNNQSAKLSILKLPMTKFGRFMPTINTGSAAVAVINSKTKNPKEVMKYIDFMFKEKTNEVLTYGFEGEHFKIENGIRIPIDVEKNKIEVGYQGDLRMITSEMNDKYYDKNYSFYEKNPSEKKYLEIIRDAEQKYFASDLKMARITYPAFMPALPEELAVMQATFSGQDNKISNVLVKSILSKDVPVDRTIEDCKNIWKQAGGLQIEEFYKKWYRQNKNNIVSMKDIIELVNPLK